MHGSEDALIPQKLKRRRELDGVPTGEDDGENGLSRGLRHDLQARCSSRLTGIMHAVPGRGTDHTRCLWRRTSMDDVVASRFSCRWTKGKWCREHQKELVRVAADMTSRVVMACLGRDIDQATADPAAIGSSLLDVSHRTVWPGRKRRGTVLFCFSAPVLVHRKS